MFLGEKKLIYKPLLFIFLVEISVYAAQLAYHTPLQDLNLNFDRLHFSYIDFPDYDIIAFRCHFFF
jgi:hypothetical protein